MNVFGLKSGINLLELVRILVDGFEDFLGVCIQELAGPRFDKNTVVHRYEVQESGDPHPLTQRRADVERRAAADCTKAGSSIEDWVQSLRCLGIHDAIYAHSYAVLARASPYLSRLFPTLAPKIVSAETTITRAAQPPPMNPADSCYYCWEYGYRMGTCPDLWSDEGKDFIKRENGRLVYKDGTALRCFGRGMREDVLVRIDAERGHNSHRWSLEIGSFLEYAAFLC